ncbi:MAG: response regulator [Elusimicrobiota bacterium]|nr:response regulator [Elusimicrobiota bacterium]
MPITILAADDDKAILRLYTRMFSGEGYALTKVETFEEAAALISRNDYDLLITDLMFPDGIGTELIKAFNKKKADARTLLVTGSTNAREMLAGEGMNEYIEKPFKVENFLEAVNKVLS